jgi:DNA-binding IclR family transcriptional regulator
MVKSAQRTLHIMEVLADAHAPISVTELHRLTGYPRSSLHQLLHTMASMQWIDFTRDGTFVGVGTRALIVGTSQLDWDETVTLASLTLERIRDETGFTSHFARREGSHVIYLATRKANEAHRATPYSGRQLPAHATALGKILLAELSPAEVSQVLPTDGLTRLTAETITDVARLEAELKRIRSVGHSIEREENTVGIACVGVAVPYRIPATDAISCSIPLSQATDNELERVATIVKKHAATLAADLRSKGIR